MPHTCKQSAPLHVCCRSVNLDKKQKMFYGIACASLSGAVGSLFSPGFNVVTNDAFHNLDPGVKPLSVYTGYALQQPIWLQMTIHQCMSESCD